MASFQTWIKALRAPFFTASIIPVVIGALLAWNNRYQFDWTIFLLTLLMAVCVHGGVNLSNDYFDHKSGNDASNKHYSQFNGGSRVIQDKLIRPKQVLYAAIMLFTLGFIFAVYLDIFVPGNLLISLALTGMVLGFFYSADPIKFSYHTFGEIAVAASFGPLLTLFSYHAMTGIMTMNAFIISLPVAFLIFLVLFINEFPDFEADKKTKKNTIVVVLGKKKSTLIYAFGLMMAYVTLVFAALRIGLFLLIGLLSIPLGVKAYMHLKKNYDKPKELLPANGMTIGLHLITGLLIILSLILNKIF
jgi:1,4-dihydroxy-2-naphthoate polyprenyltransferase